MHMTMDLGSQINECLELKAGMKIWPEKLAIKFKGRIKGL